jgi:hypothetical protein
MCGYAMILGFLAQVLGIKITATVAIIITIISSAMLMGTIKFLDWFFYKRKK